MQINSFNNKKMLAHNAYQPTKPKNTLLSISTDIITLIITFHLIALALVIFGLLQGNPGTDMMSQYIKNIINIII